MNTLYLDMDGVMADWNQGVRDIVGYDKDPNAHYADDEWAKIVANERIYRDLPPTPWALDLAKIARRFRDDLGWRLLFLTAVPKGNDVPWAFYDKTQWGMRYFPDIAVHFGPFARQKQEHCQKGDILVDDRKANCREWTAREGIAIEVVLNQELMALEELTKLYLRLKNPNENVG